VNYVTQHVSRKGENRDEPSRLLYRFDGSTRGAATALIDAVPMAAIVAGGEAIWSQVTGDQRRDYIDCTGFRTSVAIIRAISEIAFGCQEPRS
jgi:hypothetical protein